MSLYQAIKQNIGDFRVNPDWTVERVIEKGIVIRNDRVDIVWEYNPDIVFPNEVEWSLILGINLDGSYYRMKPGDYETKQLPFNQPLRFGNIGYDPSQVLETFRDIHQSG